MLNVVEINRLREQLRGYRFQEGQVKVGELGGGTDTPFEMAFSNLAHAYVKDKAPKLLDHEVGFQLIEKNQDNTKAVGVLGCKVGKQWIYIPVFFLNGDLKGHELLYLKNEDHFVPLSENWIDHILGKKPAVLGEGTNRNLGLLGIMPPNLYQLSKSPQKFASAGPMQKTAGYYAPLMASWARDVMPAFAHAAMIPLEKQAGVDLSCKLPEFLKEAGEDALRFLLEKVGSQYPTLIQAIDHYYGPEMLTDVARHIAQQKAAGNSRSLFKEAGRSCSMGKRKRLKGRIFRKRSADEKSNGKANGDEGDLGSFVGEIGPMMGSPKGVDHKVISKEMVKNDPSIVHDLKADERETLLKERVVYRDTRDKRDVTIAYNVQTQLVLNQPDHTGVYDVLTKPDVFTRCLVIMWPYGHRRREDFCTVIRLEGKKAYTNTHPANVYVRSETDIDAWKKWLETQKDADSIPLRRKNKDGYPDYRDNRRFVVVGPTGEGTCPFSADEEYTGSDASPKLYDVNFRDYSSGRRPSHLPSHYQRDLYDGCGSFGSGHAEQIALSPEAGTKLRLVEGQVQVPKGYKLIQVTEDEDRDGSDPIRLCGLGELQTMIMGNTYPLKVVSDGADVTVEENRREDKTAAVARLFRDYGLSKAAAEEIVSKAIKHQKYACGLVFPENVVYPADPRMAKLAAPGPDSDMIRSAPNAPPFPEPYTGYDPMTGGNIPTMQESEFNLPVQDMSASKTDRSIYYPYGPDPQSMQTAQNAANSGQKEVFDTAMLSGLLKAMRHDSMVDKYMGDLMKGLDRLGRILFQYYWHGEEFEERYGKDTMPELEDGLRNTFEGMGDILMELKKKSVETGDEGNVDLGPVANQ